MLPLSLFHLKSTSPVEWIRSQCCAGLRTTKHGNSLFSKLTNKEKWRFCPGTMNQADIPSGGCSADDRIANDLWWSGPSFLKEPPELWPDTRTTYPEEKTSEELIKNPPVITHSLTTTSAAQTHFENVGSIVKIEWCGSKLKLLRVNGYVLKFTLLLRRNNSVMKSENLNADDLNLASKVFKFNHFLLSISR